MKHYSAIIFLMLVISWQGMRGQDIIWSAFSMGYSEAPGIKSMVGQPFVGEMGIGSGKITSGFLAGFKRGIDDVKDHLGLPKEYQLLQNYPNPFNPSTTVMYQLPAQSKVLLRVYNVLGQVVSTLVDELKIAGSWSETWNPSYVATGVYFYRLDATSLSDPSKHFSQTRKMVLIK